ncbi:putative thiamine transport system substrate-binding protein [Onishia taeanensis]|uniref:Putative thiamine transport system substrate-binding protein n=1 Tax=Onishia taeanensis TaxID=284577 RepID=A0A328XTS7_9GAMM|nr:ABC transporter substrate-binding protein [Halomonas taeanensis]RAR63100.1 putative thiamine transport system substrate-binding protein [Halomonas taeanensis]
MHRIAPLARSRSFTGYFGRSIAVATLSATALATALPSLAQDDALALDDWTAIEQAAQGQTVYWNAWGGDSRTNDYLSWVADELEARHDIELVHVKLSDTGTAVSRVIAEKAAGNLDEGAIDLIWINGENFAAMKDNDLLFGPFAEALPHYALTRADANPEVRVDFTVPTEGFEAPWGKAQLTFYYDSARVETPPSSMAELLDWARAHPGRFTYPLVPDFTGSTFLKQALIELTPDTAPLYQPVEESDFATVTAPLWDYLDALHPYLWREGRNFPTSGPEMKRLMGDGELSLAFTFIPSEPAAAVADFQLPPTTRSYVLDAGTLGNVHFVAIPFNASHKAGALVTANFLLSPEAQAHKQDPAVWGDRTVLDMDAVSDEVRATFIDDSDNPAALPAGALSKTLPEPHPSWMERLEAAWLERYGSQ